MDDVDPQHLVSHGSEEAASGLAGLWRVLEDLPVSVIVTDAAGVVRRWNRGAQLLFGWSPEEARGTPIFDLTVPPSTTAVADEILGASVAGEVRISRFEALRKDGRTVPVDIVNAPLATIAPREAGVVGIAVDASEASRQERRYRAILADLNVAMCVIDAEGAIEDVTPGLVSRLGTTRDRLRREDLLDVVDPEDVVRVRHHIAECRATPGATVRLPVRIRCPDGRYETMSAVVFNRLDDPDVAGMVVQFRARSDDDRLTDALREAAERERTAADQLRVADEIKHKFLESLSHELRTPLTSILGFSQMLVERGRELREDQVHDIYARLNNNAARLDGLVQDLMDIDRVGRGVGALRLEPMRLDHLVRRVVEHTSMGSREVELDLAAVEARVDVGRVEKIVQNLLINGARHTPEGTRIWVTVRQNTDQVILTVADDGPGVAADLRDVVFEPFTHGTLRTPSSPGTGIGLTLVRRFAEMHRGRAWIAERDGGGTSVHVSVPVDPRSVAGSMPPRPATPPRTASVPPVGPVVERVLATIREHVGVDIAYVTEFTAEHQLVLATDGPAERFGLTAGSRIPIEETYCTQLASERIPNLVPDTATNDLLKDLPASKTIKCYLGVPIRLPNGQIFGTLCGASSSPTELEAAHLDLVRSLADIIVEELIRVRELRLDLDTTRARIRDILSGGRLRPVFQPVVDLQSGHVVGVEALSRFPDSAVRAPTVWFAEAAEVGLGLDLEQAAIEAAVTRHRYLDTAHYLSVNASPALLASGWLATATDHIDPRRLVVEITEHATIDDYQPVTDATDELRSRGVRIAVDDAGAGNASLRHVLHIDPDLIKLDTSLIRGIATDRRRQALARSLARFATTSSASVVAEGIEDHPTLTATRRLGVRYGQGWHFDRPGPLPLRTATYEL